MAYHKMLLPEKMAENLTQLIAKGYYLSGDKLPNELQMATELGVSRATLREAFKILESRNVIEVKRGIGTFIATVPGLSQDPLGRAFIDFETDMTDICKQLQSVGEALIQKMSFCDQKTKADIRSKLEGERETSMEMYQCVFIMLDTIAIASQSSFLRRVSLLLWQLLETERYLFMRQDTATIKKIYQYMQEAMRFEDEIACISAYKSLIENLKEDVREGE